MSETIHVTSVAQIHEFLQIPSPKHPLVSFLRMKDLPKVMDFEGVKYNSGLYMIALKHGVVGSLQYGRNSYDFEDGTLVFTRPNQVVSGTKEVIQPDAKGWMLLFHPDLIRKSPLGQTIHQYNFFDYEVHEALHVSEEEQKTLTDLVDKIAVEYNQNIDRHSQKLIVSTIELILDYCTRYYDRQFFVRTNMNQDRVSEFEQLLRGYFASDKPAELGLPSVRYCGEQMSMSPNYLSDLLKKETGRSAKDHINTFVVNLAKNELLGTTAAVSEIAYDLGFEYPQHFSKLFKKRTGMSPAAFRKQN
ncbi:helix-turn-helix domain-containing protein [Gilvibacter sp.]|uniref:helix-turn-helix domain-containing protein n=1 Tax=Gilvibacter sp. TaxID=2729997 RepID=UPI003F4A5642